MTNLNDDLLQPDPESQVVEADEDLVYNPYPDGTESVIVSEPPLITIGRSKNKEIAKAKSEEVQSLSDQTK